MNNPLLESVDRSDFDPNFFAADPWHQAMSLWFAISDYLDATAQVPDEWQYRPGAGVKWTPETFNQDHGACTWEDLEECTEEDLIHTGNVLMRYVHMLEAKGITG